MSEKDERSQPGTYDITEAQQRETSLDYPDASLDKYHEATCSSGPQDHLGSVETIRHDLPVSETCALAQCVKNLEREVMQMIRVLHLATDTSK